jgi:tetratricopeptide (TPR) repeat protein
MLRLAMLLEPQAANPRGVSVMIFARFQALDDMPFQKPNLLPWLSLTLLLGCSESPTPTQNERHSGSPNAEQASRQITPPVEIDLLELSPEFVALVAPLIDQAKRDLADGAHRGRLGIAYEANGFPDAAYASYVQATSLDTDDARWPYHLALMQAARGELAAAIDSIDEAAARDSSYAALWMWRGMWSLDLDDAERALADFERAAQLGLPAAAEAGRARALLHQGKPEEAVAILEPLSRAASYPSVFYLLGRAYRDAGNAEAARIALARGDATMPLSWHDPWVDEKLASEVGFQADSLRALRMMREGNHADAITMLKALQEREPDNPVIINALGEAYAEYGEQEKAFWVLRRAVAKEPVHYTVHLNIAPFYQTRGDIGAALEHLDKAIASNPDVALPYTRKGLLLQQQREYEAALVQFKLALDRSANDPNAFFYVGDAEILLENWSEGIKRFQQAVDVDPAFTLGHINLGLAYARTGRFEDSRAALAIARSIGTHDEDVDAAIQHVTRLEAAR